MLSILDSSEQRKKSININNITVYQVDFLGKHAYKNKYIGENNRKKYGHCIQIVQFQRNANGCTVRRNEDKNRKKSLPKIKFEKQLLLMNDVPSFLLTMNF